MRMVFGLAGLLVTVGVIVWVIIVMMPTTQQAVTGVRQQRDVVKQVAGYDQDGGRAADTITLADMTAGGKFSGALVTSIKTGGAMEKHFGLKRNDTIIEIGPLTAPDIGSASAAKDFLVDAYQTAKQIVVIRDEKKITLPAAGAPAGTPQAPAASKSPLQRQLDTIQKSPAP